HYSVTLDLYGSEISSNAANYYTTGLKGRFEEGRLTDDHRLASDEYPVQEVQGNRVVTRGVPALTAINARLRDHYIKECQAGLDRRNRMPEQLGIPFRCRLPHLGFHRKIGNFAGHHVDPAGEVITESDWNARRNEWLPSAEDHEFIESLMGRVVEPGKF